MKLHFGCGTNILQGWENYDMDLDITKRLPFEDGVADFIFIEHAIEHIKPGDAYSFLVEAWRILKPGGVIRLAFPDIERIATENTEEYAEWVQEKFGVMVIENIIRLHGHQSVWTRSTMIAVLKEIGFACHDAFMWVSTYPELRKLEGHGDVIGDIFNSIETTIVEGIKVVKC